MQSKKTVTRTITKLERLSPNTRAAKYGNDEGGEVYDIYNDQASVASSARRGSEYQADQQTSVTSSKTALRRQKTGTGNAVAFKQKLT